MKLIHVWINSEGISSKPETQYAWYEDYRYDHGGCRINSLLQVLDDDELKLQVF